MTTTSVVGELGPAASAASARTPASGLPAGRGPRRSRAHPASYDVRHTDGGEVRVLAHGAHALVTSHAFVDDLPLAGAFGDVVPARCADVVDVAVATYVADRLCRRQPTRVGRTGEPLWQRRMHLEIPVREPDRWAARDVVATLQELLRSLTDDAWTFTFVPRRPATGRVSESQGALFREPVPPPASAALFSGGLDSLAGLVARLTGHPTETVVVFSGRTNTRIGAPQRRQLEALDAAFPRRVRPVAVRFGLDRRARGAYDREETSQRTRGFAFQAFGAVTAYMAGLDRLDVYENGVGAINLPYTDAQLGSQATRAAHPRTLGLMSALLSRVLEEPFTVTLPFLFESKGELCDRLRAAGLGYLAGLTVSCDGYPQRRKIADQCGVCPSCLLRRQSLHHADLLDADPQSLYVHDIYNAAAPDAWERRAALRVMGGQVHHLRQALASERPWDALVTRYPSLDEAADAIAAPASTPGRPTAPEAAHETVCDRLISLYRRYCDEWKAFAASTSGPRDGAPDGTPVDALDRAARRIPHAGLLAVPPNHRPYVAPVRTLAAPRVSPARVTPDLWHVVDSDPTGESDGR